MATKLWISDALQILKESLAPVPHEQNELDWKAQLSDHKDRLAEHLMAFASHPNGGYLVFGVNDAGQPVGVDQQQVASIVSHLAHLGRDAIDPPLALDHAVTETADKIPLLLVRIPEQAVKPAHRRGKSIEETWVRSGGTTRKASRHEVGALMLNSGAPHWEELRASPLLKLADVQQLLDLDAIAHLLQRPAPIDAEDLARWLVQEGITTIEGRGHYITNPGALLPGKRPDRLIGATPESRNEKLASSFRRFRICEERGTGFQKVVQAIELFGLPPLQITPHDNAFSVTLGAPRKFADMGSAERIEACYQHAVLQYLSSQTLTNTSLRERFKLHDKQRNSITNLISDAVDAGRIKRKDAHSGNKFAEYIPYWV